MTMINVDIDGHQTEVDAADWGSDPDSIIADVRAARLAITDLSGLYEVPEWDYDSLAVAFGSDDTAEVDS